MSGPDTPSSSPSLSIANTSSPHSLQDVTLDEDLTDRDPNQQLFPESGFINHLTYAIPPQSIFQPVSALPPPPSYSDVPPISTSIITRLTSPVSMHLHALHARDTKQETNTLLWASPLALLALAAIAFAGYRHWR